MGHWGPQRLVVGAGEEVKLSQEHSEGNNRDAENWEQEGTEHITTPTAAQSPALHFYGASYSFPDSVRVCLY